MRLPAAAGRGGSRASSRSHGAVGGGRVRKRAAGAGTGKRVESGGWEGEEWEEYRAGSLGLAGEGEAAPEL